MSAKATAFTQALGIRYPIICGAMYPCSNLELVAAVSEAGGIGIIQPVSLVYAHHTELREGIRKIRQLTKNPVGYNLLVEKSSKKYEERMRAWLDIAIEEGIRFFVTALGNPRWVVEKVKPLGGIVYHDVTERKWALKAAESDVDGFICVNNRAGGHAGKLSPEQLFAQLEDLKKPLICAGGVGNQGQLRDAMAIGYSGVQLGTRFIATEECSAHADYKKAILAAEEKDIVLTNKISGVPVSIIRTPYVEKIGTEAGPIARWLLRGNRTKHWMRLFYLLRSIGQLKKANSRGASYRDYWQAGKSVSGIDRIVSAKDVVRTLGEAL